MTSLAASPTARPVRRELHPFARTGLTILAVGLAGLALGGVTSPAQQYLPEWMSSLANSSSGWTLATAALVALSRLRVLPAAYAGSLAMVLMVEGYGIVSTLRGYPNGPPLEGLFTIAGLFVGFLIGGATAVLRDGSPLWRALAIVPLAAVLIGEGVYGLTVVAETTGPVYWAAILVSGVAFTTWQIRRQRPGARMAACVVALIFVASALFWAAYRLPLAPLF